MPFQGELILNVLLYLCSFLLIWIGSGYIITSLDRFSKKLKLSTFTVSFVVLGLLTSIPEFAVGLTAVAQNDPEIYVGNLLGGIPVIFLFIVPILAILGNGVRLQHHFDKKYLIATLGVIAAPSLLVLDRSISNMEGVVLILLYFILFLLVQKNHGFFDDENTEVLNIKAYSYGSILKILFGVALVFIASHLIVEKTLYFSTLLNTSPFFISLIILSLGTNLPELSIAARAILSGKKDIALGDYMGSAAANTLLFGIFTLLSHGEVLQVNNFPLTFFFIVTGLITFYIFTRSKNQISKKEGLLLLGFYVIFAVAELIRG